MLFTGNVCRAEGEFTLPINDALFLEPVYDENLSENESPRQMVFFQSLPERPFEEYIIEKCLNQEEAINVESYNLTLSEFSKRFYDIVLRHPEIMSITGYAYNTNYDTGYVARFTPDYLFETKAEADAARTALQNKVDEYINLANNVSGDLEKLLIIHDKIAYDYSYEHDYVSLNNSGDYFCYHPYGFILRGKAVCQGYSSLLYMVCSQIGIEADFCRSNNLNHVWNYIKIDGTWYHTDLTWDDPTIHINGTEELRKTAYHSYFLRSDADFSLPNEDRTGSSSHGAFDTWARYAGETLICDSGKFEKNHIFNIPYATTIFYDNGSFVFPYNSGIKFESPTPFTGTLAITKPYNAFTSDNIPVIRIAFYCVGDTDVLYTSFVKRVKDDVSRVGSFNAKTEDGLKASSILKKNDGTTYSFFFLNPKTLKPLCHSYSIIDV